jgi:hypothetical protein
MVLSFDNPVYKSGIMSSKGPLMKDDNTAHMIFNLALKSTEQKRKFARFAVHAKAQILTGDQIIEGEIDNLSLKGTFVKTHESIKIGTVVTISISDTLTTHEISNLKARVIMTTKEGFGLQFE